ncbi:hypothetical protein [Methylocystis bryophila]|uniref:hypothetical protein n=1 Tax=Methylocystis bryophila TaxID=655015 RepID=UPI00131A110C|nr:hypothetical protein [Methylocystis bryophila]
MRLERRVALSSGEPRFQERREFPGRSAQKLFRRGNSARRKEASGSRKIGLVLAVWGLQVSSPCALANDYPSDACALVGPALVEFRSDQDAAGRPSPELVNGRFLLAKLGAKGDEPQRLFVYRTKLEDTRRALGGYSLFFPEKICPDGCTAYAVKYRGTPSIVELYYRARVVLQQPVGASGTKSSVPGGLIFLAKDRHSLILFSDANRISGRPMVFHVTKDIVRLAPFSHHYQDCLLNLAGEGNAWWDNPQILH